jgi:hypothetical protein
MFFLAGIRTGNSPETKWRNGFAAPETKNPRLYQFEVFAGQNAIGVIES